MSSCSTQGCCEEEKTSKTASCCACGTDCGGDPVACSMILWKGSFFRAMTDLQTEVLKEKLKKAWGPQMDKAADAVIEAMGTKWQSMLNESRAKETLHSKLSKLFTEGK